MSEILHSIELTIKDFITRQFIIDTNGQQLSKEDSFLEKGIIDSTGILELINFIQLKFKVEITDEELIPENLDSISGISNFIQRKQAQP
jgi:acyl carrier protein